MHEHQLAQLNVARMVARIDDPKMADFVAWLDVINRLAERSTGFVWRLHDESGNATSLPVTDDPYVIANLTVWRSVEDLRVFTYRSDHRLVFVRRYEWFERWPGPSVVMWWIPAGTIPTIQEGLQRLALLAAEGPSQDAFTFKQPFHPPTAVAL
jgi:hypothetical protein